MAKPYSKNEVGYMRHRKFLALNGNAISLWHEGKDYCSEHLTDGLIPFEAVKTFRFAGRKTIDLLTASCGSKPDGTAYAPLWEPHTVGYKMHDYLEHNDAYKVVRERIEGADERREAERRRKQEWRDRKAERRVTDRRDQPRDPQGHFVPVPVNVPGAVPWDMTGVSPSNPTPTPSTSTPPDGGVPRARPMAPIHTSHKRHVVCGKVCLHASQFEGFVRRRNGDDRLVRKWAEGVIAEWTTGDHANDEPGDEFDFWRARYAEAWPPTLAAKASKPDPYARLHASGWQTGAGGVK